MSRTDGWEEPTPLDVLTTRPAFPTEALPLPLRAWVEAEAEAVQVPPDLPAVIALGVLATVAAGRSLIEPATGWQEGLNLFVAAVLDPGERKSPVFRDATAPVRAFEQAELERLRPEIIRTKTEREIAEARLVRLRAEAAKAKTPDDRYAAQADAQTAAEDLEALRVVVEPRLYTTDVTAEKLASLLAEQGGRFAILSAEGGTFDRIAGLYTAGQPNLDVFLMGHAGDDIHVDRQGRPSQAIERPALTLGLTIQPTSLASIRKNPAIRGRGLLDRFLYAVPEGRIGRRGIDAPAVPTSVAEAYGRMVEHVACRLGDAENPWILRLSPAAAERFGAFRRELEPRRGPAGDLGSIAGWASKLDGAVARIAGLLHLATLAAAKEVTNRPIDAATMANACRIGTYFIDHALLAFDAMGADEHRAGARRILAWLAKDPHIHFSQRDVQRSLHRAFPSVVEIGPALSLLEAHGFIRLRSPDSRAGRPSVEYDVNPLPPGDR